MVRLRRAAYMVCQCFPELAVDERYDAAGVFWRAAVILAVTISVWSVFEVCIVLIDGYD